MAKSVFCPNAGCQQHSTPDPSLFIKKGKATGYKNKTYQRFLCKVCGTKFSDRKLQWDSPFRKKQPLIQEVFTRYTSGTNINQLRDDLKVNKRSILKIIQFVANKVRLVGLELGLKRHSKTWRPFIVVKLIKMPASPTRKTLRMIRWATSPRSMNRTFPMLM